MAAQRRVEAELNEVLRHASEAHASFEVAVAAVAVGEARRLVAVLDEAETQVQQLRCRIAGLQLPGMETPQDVARRPFTQLPPTRPSDADKAGWTKLLARLRRDPDATLSGN